MKFFIDTANLEQIQEAYDLGVLVCRAEMEPALDDLNPF